MRFLLDTHVALWLAVDPTKMSATTIELVRDVRNELLFSTASVWEISIKYAADKLRLPAPPQDFVQELQWRLRLSVLPIELPHAIRAGGLPALHRDPFDRMLIAQAQLLELPIVTVDPKLAQYDVEIVAG